MLMIFREIEVCDPDNKGFRDIAVTFFPRSHHLPNKKSPSHQLGSNW